MQNDSSSGNLSVVTTVQVTKLSRFFYVVSHIAMNQLVYIESCLRKIQKQKAKKERMVAEGQSIHCNGTTPPDAPKVMELEMSFYSSRVLLSFLVLKFL